MCLCFLKGVQLSQLGFAACQSKNCTNQDNIAISFIGALLALASGEAERRQVHPLIGSYSFTVRNRLTMPMTSACVYVCCLRLLTCA